MSPINPCWHEFNLYNCISYLYPLRIFIVLSLYSNDNFLLKLLQQLTVWGILCLHLDVHMRRTRHSCLRSPLQR